MWLLLSLLLPVICACAGWDVLKLTWEHKRAAADRGSPPGWQRRRHLPVKRYFRFDPKTSAFSVNDSGLRYEIVDSQNFDRDVSLHVNGEAFFSEIAHFLVFFALEERDKATLWKGSTSERVAVCPPSLLVHHYHHRPFSNTLQHV